MTGDGEAGRVFFSSTGRSLDEADEVCLLSVGVDIGSSTSHLVFSRIVLERLDSRYIIAERETFYGSDILLTPYRDGETIDADALGAFIRKEYSDAKVDPDEIDSGALILTGVAAQRRNARAIGELFARQAGKLVAVSAGDSMETMLAAHGSGAVARSIRDACTVMNVDVGGGTSKIALCQEGRVVSLTAVDIGARLICMDAAGRVTRIEPAGAGLAREAGFDLQLDDMLRPDQAQMIAAFMADRLFDAMKGGNPRAGNASLLRLDPLAAHDSLGALQFSGGVSEFMAGAERRSFGDLGPLLAAEISTRASRFCDRVETAHEGLRATVVGASQYTVQLSGSTVYISPLDVLPLRNVPVLAPALPLGDQAIVAAAVAMAIRSELQKLELAHGEQPVALFVPWEGSATFQRIDAFCRGAADGLSALTQAGHPLILVGDGDVGGLLGLHLRDEMRRTHPIVSIDGLTLQAFDYIDIGAMLDASGAVPVVIKSLMFPGTSVKA